MYRKNIESGRSMVEILGVLAVMGVLSVAGISGFKNAMDRNRANELLYEANKRATIAAMQFASGRKAASLTEFSGNSIFSGGTFDDTAEIKLENDRFKITLNSVLPEICQRIKKTVGINTTIRKVVCSTEQIGLGLFWFNSDLNSKDPQGDLCDAINNIYCDYGQICTTSGQVAGTCVNKEENWECLTNEDCFDKPNTFCEILASDENTITGGKCTPLGNSSGEKLVEGLGKLELKSGNGLNWWSAQNWCTAKEKKLFDISGDRLKCYHGTEAITFTSERITVSYCCAYNEESSECVYGTPQSIPMQNLETVFGVGQMMWVAPAGYRLMLGYGSNHNRNIHGGTRTAAFKALCE